MSSKQLGSDGQEPHKDTDVVGGPHPITYEPVQDKKPLNEIEVMPEEQQRIPLGSFGGKDEPKGFSIGITPEPDPTDSVVTAVTTLGTASRYEFVLHVANYGGKPVTAKVWQL